MPFYKDETLGLFIDGVDTYNTARVLGFSVDYKKILDLFAARGRLIRSYYYTTVVTDSDGHVHMHALLDWLDYNGYAVRTQPHKEYTDSQGRYRVRGDIGADLATDVMEMAEHFNHVILFSGERKFIRLVQALKRKGIRVTLVGHKERADTDLRRTVDTFLNIKDLQKQITRSNNSDMPEVSEHEDE